MADEGQLDDGRLFYRCWPSGGQASAHVVLAHGYGEHSGRYDHVGRFLADAGYAVWAIDHRGHGKSAGARGDIESFAAVVADLDLLVDVVEEQAAGRPVILLGHSMGSAIATAYAQQHQSRLAALALSAPVMSVPAEVIALGDLETIPELPLADAISRDPAVVQGYKDDPLVYTGPPARGFLLAMREVAGIHARLAELQLPVLVMQGSGDLLVSPQGLRDVVAGVGSADLVARLWPGLFHEIFNEPEQQAVLAFLASWLTQFPG